MAALSAGAVTLAVLVVATDQAGADGQAALYTAFGGVLVSLIGGGFAYASSRRNHDERPPPMEPTTHALPRELIELHEDERDRLIQERDKAAGERDMWMQRAYEAGWSP